MCHSMSYFTNKLLLKYALIFLPEALELFCNLLSIFRPKKKPLNSWRTTSWLAIFILHMQLWLPRADAVRKQDALHRLEVLLMLA